MYSYIPLYNLRKSFYYFSTKFHYFLRNLLFFNSRTVFLRSIYVVTGAGLPQLSGCNCYAMAVAWSSIWPSSRLCSLLNDASSSYVCMLQPQYARCYWWDSFVCVRSKWIVAIRICIPQQNWNSFFLTLVRSYSCKSPQLRLKIHNLTALF